MKHLFLINPAAGKFDHTEAFTNAIRAAFAGRREAFEIAVSQAPGHLTELAREACRAGESLRLYACGGDGTLNEVVNGAVDFPNAAVTHYPGGSGNDFIKLFSDPAAFFDLERLLESEEAAFDLIRAGDRRYALNICSMGFDARIGTEIARYKRLPLVTGQGAYVLSAVVNTIRGIHQPFRVEVDGQECPGGDRTLICVANGRWYGGSFNPVPEAEPDDGLLDVLLVEPVSRLTVARVIGKYKQGRYRQYPRLIAHRRCRNLRVQSPRPTAVNVDGELLTETDITFSVAERKIRFFYPAGLQWHSDLSVIQRNPE